jgi:hypothetical protein
MLQAKLLCAQKIQHARELLTFLRTRTVPPILWTPAEPTEAVKQLFEARSSVSVALARAGYARGCSQPLHVCAGCGQRAMHPRAQPTTARVRWLWPAWRSAADVCSSVQQQAQEFEVWADKQATKLQAEQKGMRERAERQWEEIDRMHEEQQSRRLEGALQLMQGADTRSAPCMHSTGTYSCAHS